MSTMTAYDYRRPRFDPSDELFRRCLTGSGIIGLAFLVAVLLTPIRQRILTHVEQLPPRFARLILEPKKAVNPGPVPTPAQSEIAAPTKPPGGGGGGGGGKEGEAPKQNQPEPAPLAPPSRGSVVAPNAGQAGRARADAEVRRTLATSSRALTGALASLSTSFGATASEVPIAAHGGRARVLRSARGESDLAHVNTSLSSTGGADLGRSVVVGSLIGIGELSNERSSGSGGGSGGGTGGGLGDGSGNGVGSGSGGGTGGGSGGGVGTGTGGGTGPGSGGGGLRGPSAPGVYRSNASLLAVIQRYSAGIQYCYGNELKRDPTLRGKLVVAITVAASGEVLEATVVQNTVGSDRLASCALSQIREWRFPAIPQGVTAFQAPFVFTPPS